MVDNNAKKCFYTVTKTQRGSNSLPLLIVYVTYSIYSLITDDHVAPEPVKSTLRLTIPEADVLCTWRRANRLVG